MRRLRPVGIFGSRITPRSEKRADRPDGGAPPRRRTLNIQLMPNSRQTSITITHMDSTGYVLACLLLPDSSLVGEPDVESSETGMTSESDRRPAYGEQMAKHVRLAP